MLLQSLYVVEADSTSITGVLTLLASRDDKAVYFRGAASTFSILSSQADNGVVVIVDVTTTTGAIYLDGDIENSSTEDTVNSVRFTDGRTVTAKSVLTLESSNGFIQPAQSATMAAGAGMVIHDTFFANSQNTMVVLNSDNDSVQKNDTSHN